MSQRCISILILSYHIRLGLPSDLCSPGSFTKTQYIRLPSPIRTTCPVSLILILTTRKISGKEKKSLCCLLRSSVISAALDPNIFLSILFSNTPSPCFSHSVRDQVSHPYKITGKIIVLIFYYNLVISTLHLCMMLLIVECVFAVSHC